MSFKGLINIIMSLTRHFLKRKVMEGVNWYTCKNSGLKLIQLLIDDLN